MATTDKLDKLRKKLTFKSLSDQIKSSIYLYKRSKYNKQTKSADFEKIQKYLMFVGYPRSGHSLIGAILDAHPNIVLAHELDVLKYINKTKSDASIFSKIIARSEWFVKNGCIQEGYTYKIPNQWQGKYDELKVIGDKKGGATTRRLGKDFNALSEINKIIHKDILLIHVIRNPFDNITTRARGGSHVLREVNDELLLKHIQNHFRLVETIHRIKNEYKVPMLDVYNEDFVSDPKKEITRICKFLEVTADSEYLNDCASIIFKSAKKTRNQINWKPEFIEMVQKQIDKYDFLKGYSFYATILLLIKILNQFFVYTGSINLRSVFEFIQ